MVCVTHVGEDSQGHLLHLLAEVDDGKLGPATPFIQTPSGVQSVSTGASKLTGNVQHRFSGTFNGSKKDYINRAYNSGYDPKEKKESLLRMGITNLRRGSGAIVFGAIAVNIMQVSNLWSMYSADGIITPEEHIRMAAELAETGNVAIAAVEAGSAVIQGEDIIEAAADPGIVDQIAGGAIDAIGALLGL